MRWGLTCFRRAPLQVGGADNITLRASPLISAGPKTKFPLALRDCLSGTGHITLSIAILIPRTESVSG
jgi:hypothetical protein